VVVTTPASVGPTILPTYAKCNNVSNSICPAGTGCFKNNDLYWECRPSCPPTWACETAVLGPNEQCGGMIYAKQTKVLNFSFFLLGEGYVGLTRCAKDLRCYIHSKWYSQCAASCPGAGWAC
jgi:hypothetical protein